MGRGGPASTSSDTGGVLDLDADSPYISLRSSRQNSLQDPGPASKDVELEASVLDTLTDSVLTGESSTPNLIAILSCMTNTSIPLRLSSSWWQDISVKVHMSMSRGLPETPCVLGCSLHVDASGLDGAASGDSGRGGAEAA